MTATATLSALSASALLNAYNGAIADFGAPEGMAEVPRFASKAKAIEAIEALCAAGSLAYAFDGEGITFTDVSEATDDAASEAAGEAADDAASEAAYGDGKGKRRAWGFVLGSDAWLEANPRGTPAREAYRKARRAAARAARKARKAAVEA